MYLYMKNTEDPDKCSTQNASCHLCENINTSTMFLSEILKDPTIHEVFETYIPEIKLNKEKDPVICVDCQQCLSKFSSWVNTWSYANKQWTNKVLEHQNNNKHLSDEHGQKEIINDLLQESDTTDVTLGSKHINEISGEPKEIINDLLQESAITDVTPSINHFHEISDKPKQILNDLLQESETLYINHFETSPGNHVENLMEQNLSSFGDALNEGDGPFEEDIKELTHESIDIKCEDIVENKFPVDPKIIGALVGSTFNTCERNVLRINLKRLDFEPKKIQIILTRKDDAHKSVGYSVSDEVVSLEPSQYATEPLYEVISNPYVKNGKSNPELVAKPIFKCPHCRYKTKSETYLKTHLENHAKSEIPVEKNPITNSYECKYCHYRPRDRSNFDKHMRCHRNPEELTMFKCGKCPYQAKEKSHLKTHMKWHNKYKETFACYHCTYRSTNKMSFIYHMVTHSRYIKTLQNCYECLICSYKVITLTGMRYHIMRKHEKNTLQLKCEECDLTTTHKYNLKVHMKVHKKSKELLKCSQCSYNTHDTYNFHKHVRVTHTTTWFNCEQCEFRTHLPRCLNIHKKTHEKKTMHHCDICPYKSPKKYYLELHKRRHQPKKECLFKCNKCDFQTKYQRSLSRHTVIHSTGDEFGMHYCEMCEYKTKCKGRFNRHLSVHERKKCAHCSFTAENSSKLERHAVIHQTLTESQFYKCRFCSFLGKRKEYVNAHIKRMHPKKLPTK